MDATTFRKIKHAARHAVAARWVVATPGVGPFGAGLAVAVESLGLGDPADVAAAGGLERLAAQIRVRHGDRALLVFQLQVGMQILTATVARGGAGRHALLEMARSVANAGAELGLSRIADAVEALYEQIRDNCVESRLAERVADLDAALDAALGIAEVLRHGSVSGLDVSYAEIYRAGRLLGVLRADALLTRQGDERLATELPFALDMIGFRGDVPVGSVSDEEAAAIWDRVEATLGIAVGGLAVEVHRLALNHALCRNLEFPGLALRKGLGDMANCTRALGGSSLAAAIEDRLRGLVGVDLAIEDAAPVQVEDLLDRVDSWLDALLPRVGLDGVLAGRIVVCEDRFAGYQVPVTAARIERFVDQFPADLRWVATGLLDAVEYRDRAQLSRSIAFLLSSFGVQSMESATLCGLECTHELAFRGPDIELPHRKLTSALGDRTVSTLVVVDDVCLDPAPMIAELEALDASGKKRLRRVNLVFAFSVATAFGESALRDYLTKAGLLFQILVGQRLNHLSAAGWQQRPEVLTEIELAEPLFSPHNPHWRGMDWRVARVLCVEIGSALGDPRDALGRRGHQGRLAFAHRIPPSTLTLFHGEGSWRGAQWIPLFSVPRL